MKSTLQYEVNEVIFYAISRLNFHRIEYSVHNSTTGSTYIRIGVDKIRIADHAGVYDDYNYIIRCDCKTPVQIKGKLVVPAELSDTILDLVIEKYRRLQGQDSVLQKIATNKKWSENDYKRVDMGLLLAIIKHNKKDETPSKKECLDRIVKGPGLVFNYYNEEDFENRYINTEK